MSMYWALGNEAVVEVLGSLREMCDEASTDILARTWCPAGSIFDTMAFMVIQSGAEIRV